MSRKLSIVEKAEISVRLEKKAKQSEIAKLYDVSQATISKLAKKINETGSIARKSGSGRPSSLSSEDTAFLIAEVKKDPRVGSNKLTNELLKHRNISVSPRTIRYKLSSIGLKGRLACFKPLLTKKHALARINFAKKHISWSNTSWDQVIWSDETKVNLFGSDGRMYVRRKDGTRFENKNLIPTIKHGGGNVMLWGCFSSKGVGELTFIDGKMDRFEYSRILDGHLASSAKKMGLEKYIFQQDNDPKHSSKHVKEYLADKHIDVMEWPSQSPDLNPIEHLWSIIKKKIAPLNCKNITELKAAIVTEWNNIDVSVCEKLVYSMKKRCEEVLKSKGYHTSY